MSHNVQAPASVSTSRLRAILLLPILTLALAIPVVPMSATAQQLKPNVLDPSYNHDLWGTSSTGILADFRAYRSSFDDMDDDDGFGGSDAMGVPEWVAYEIKKFDGPCIQTRARPSTWITDSAQRAAGLMPDDSSYRTTQAFRAKHPSWFSRGHLAMKLLAERMGSDAAWNTHTFYNAVPQRASFNEGIWLDLEKWTGAWANHFGAVWVVTGPVFGDRHPYAHLGDPGEFPVAIPEALFKIIIREGADPAKPEVLAFLYPQIGPGYSEKPFNHFRYVATVDEIEALTGLDFLMNLPDDVETEVERSLATTWWAADGADFVRACSGDGD